MDHGTSSPVVTSEGDPVGMVPEVEGEGVDDPDEEAAPEFEVEDVAVGDGVDAGSS